MRALVRISIAYEEDITNAMKALEDVCSLIKEEKAEDLVEGPTPLGVSELGESGVTLLVFAKTRPMMQWSMERELRKRIKDEFDQRGIEIPYPRRVVINNQDGRGFRDEA